MKIPRQWALTALYMVFIACVMIGMMHYAKNHPLEDMRATSSTPPAPLPAAR